MIETEVTNVSNITVTKNSDGTFTLTVIGTTRGLFDILVESTTTINITEAVKNSLIISFGKV